MPLDHLHPILKEALLARGITTPDKARAFLNPDEYTPASPYALDDMTKAVEHLRTAIQQKQRIFVWGDFDVDGQTSTALLVSGLRELGASVSYYLPHREKEGHGISTTKLADFISNMDILLTCDTGITAHSAVDYAQAQNVTVIITDHHALADTLPNAYAVVNPMRLPEKHPLRELSGVGVAYKLIEALFEAFNKPEPTHLLDLVAVGMLADVMVLVDDTRYLVQRGIQVLRQSPRAGFKKIIAKAELLQATLSENEIGFSIAPRLNAFGRLSDANSIVEFLTTDDDLILESTANTIEGMNQERRLLTRQVYKGAKEKISTKPDLLDYAVLVVSGNAWHIGVLGIVASQLAEEYQKPTIVLSEHGEKASGSGRSIAGADLLEALKTQAPLLAHFGGHASAAGLSLPIANIFEFRRGVSAAMRTLSVDIDFTAKKEVTADTQLTFSQINLDLVDAMEQLAPFGNGNPQLIFETQHLSVKSQRQLGRKADHLQFTLVDEHNNTQKATWWFAEADEIPQTRFTLLYTVRLSYYKGKPEILVEWRDARVEPEDLLKLEQSKISYSVLDYRQEDNKPAKLREALLEYPQALVWREATRDVDGMNRFELRPNDTLIMWSIPADAQVWTEILRQVQPRQVILLGQPPLFNTWDKLRERLMGMLKYAMSNKNAKISLNELMTHTNHTELTIQLALQCLSETTPFRMVEAEDNTYKIWYDQNKKTTKECQTQQKLNKVLTETQEYQRYWLNSLNSFNQNE
jgi:single-stranded-DNA-specific exonuclease